SPAERVRARGAGNDAHLGARRVRRRRRAGLRVPSGGDRGGDGLHGRARGRALARGSAPGLTGNEERHETARAATYRRSVACSNAYGGRTSTDSTANPARATCAANAT